MANPQTEKGFTRIANEILEHLALTRFSGCEQRIIWVVIRKTYGYQKKRDWISLSQFEKLTKMDHRNVERTIKKLVERKIILKKGTSYEFNKDWEQWVGAKQPLGVKQPLGRGQTVLLGRGELTPNKRNNTKEKNTKEIATDVAEEPFEWGSYLQKKMLSPTNRREMRIIGMFFLKKGTTFKTPQQVQVAIKRHVRAANMLKEFDNKQILEAMHKCETMRINGQEVDWKLETVVGQLTK